MSHRHDGSRPRRPTGVRRGAGIALRLLALAAILHFLVLPQIGGTRKSLGLVSGLSPLVVVGALALEAASLVAYAQLSRVLLPTGTRLPLGTAARVVLSSLAVSHLLPAGAAAGGTLQYRLLTRHGVGATDASFLIGMQSLGSAVVLNAILWVALVWSIPASGFQPVYAIAASVGAALMIAVAGAVVALTRGRARVVAAAARVLGRLPRLDADRVRAGLEGVATNLSVLLSQPRRAVAAAGWATLNWLLDAAVLWVFLAALGHPTAVPAVLVAYGLANVLAAIPVSPGGLGIVEATLVATLAGFGVPRAVAALSVAAYRLVQFWLPIPAGGLAWGSLTGRRARHLLGELDGDTPPGPPPS